MNKSFLLPIGALVVAVLLVGTIAFYRSRQPTPPPLAPIPAIPAPVNTPASAKNEIALIVSSPANEQMVTTPSILVTGHTAPNADVSINDQDIKANSQGNFSATIALEEGKNAISVTASDEDGYTSEEEVSVTYAPTQ